MNVRPWRFAALLLMVALAGCATDSPRRAVLARSPSGATQPTTAEAAAGKASAAETAQVNPADVEPATLKSPETKEDTVDVKKAVLGEVVPDFTLNDLEGKSHTLSAYRGKIVVLEWFSPACPYCVYAYAEGPLREQPERVKSQGVVWLSVNSQNPGHPGADLEKNREFVKKHGLKAPLLTDPTGVVGRSFGAKVTPHCFVINEKGLLVYAGALDNAPLGKVEGDAPKTNYVAAAITDLKSGHPVTISNTKAYG